MLDKNSETNAHQLLIAYQTQCTILDLRRAKVPPCPSICNRAEVYRRASVEGCRGKVDIDLRTNSCYAVGPTTGAGDFAKERSYLYSFSKNWATGLRDNFGESLRRKRLSPGHDFWP